MEEGKSERILTTDEAMKASRKLSLLKDALPRTAYDVTQVLSEVKSIIEGTLFDREINDLIEQVETYFKEENSIDINSDIASKIGEFRIKLDVFIEFEDYRQAYSNLLEKLEQISSVFPPRQFDFREVKCDLSSKVLPQEIIDLLESGISLFEGEQFANSIDKAGEACKILTDCLINSCEISDAGGSWSDKLTRIQRFLEESNNYKGWNLSVKMRVEWFILALLRIVCWLRNLKAHRTERNERIPPWMDDYTKSLVDSSSYARIALVLSLQAARGLQELLEHQE